MYSSDYNSVQKHDKKEITFTESDGENLKWKSAGRIKTNSMKRVKNLSHKTN